MKHPLYLLLVLLLFSCGKNGSELSEATFSKDIKTESGLSEAQLYDKILGMLVGSAIGDAMGAPTEMWSRTAIATEYGFVEGLDSMVREASPEGIWIPNLPAGGTTDDTRWKALTVNYLLTQNPGKLDPADFADHILKNYEQNLSELKKIDSSNPEPYENALLKVNWLSEWAKVSQPYIDGNLVAYSDSLSKFYGGEMVCAGLLYAPALGVFFPGDSETAYKEGYKLSIYDLGYARDLSALAVSMTAAGMRPNSSKTDLMAALRLDPEGYFESRLVGRTAYKLVKDALYISEEAKKLDSLPMRAESPALVYAYQQLDLRQQDMPFHAGEIFLQSLTAMVYSDFELMPTLIFLTNYGRDNDTTAALAGGILGAMHGFEKLPKAEREKVLQVNRDLLGIDLEMLAKQLTQHIIKK